MKFATTKVITIEAIRYGGPQGVWKPQAAVQVGQFMLGEIPPEIVDTTTMMMSVIQPIGLWDPPENCDLKIYVKKSNAWCDLHLGDWVIQESDGDGFYPCTNEAFIERGYEAVIG